MAKYERRMSVGISTLLREIHEGILNGSRSATYEDGSDFSINGVRCAVRVYERYSMIGSNRVSLSVTLLGDETNTMVSAITAGGSQAMFYKLNTFGEKAFLECLETILNKY